ncbi:lysozyme inhibitor LprI family protein [Roseibium aestuarii]|uniref:Lysozyme inhibitor LprI family protein n=1 Tax=Roseibium aestuarii TaxID=2600299 RepID=A0ABW4K1X0_9HYPH|nr:lysozyme inhibitor LprI family protein [Roseibium aestuarii]
MMGSKARISPRLALAAVAVIALTLSRPAFAQEPKLDCADAYTQSDLNRCAYQDYEAADAELNRVYAQAVAAMTEMDEALTGTGLEGAVKALRAAQRAWIPFRDAACESEGFMARGGTMEPMVVAGCMTTLTKQRIDDLKQLAEGLGN